MYDSAAYVQAGTPVGDGVRFQWRHSHPAVEPDQDMDGGEDDAANDNGTDSWQEDLSHLSGGQRSLVALALLLSVRHFTLHAAAISSPNATSTLGL